MSNPVWDAETRAIVAAVAAFRFAVIAASPELAAAVQQWPLRVSFDENEQIVTLAVVGPDGRGTPFLAVPASPGPDFGRPGVPVAVSGLYDVSENALGN